MESKRVKPIKKQSDMVVTRGRIRLGWEDKINGMEGGKLLTSSK